MIENEIKTNSTTVQKDAKATSPINKDYRKSSSNKDNAFSLWLKDNDSLDENDKVTAAVAVASYAKGLIEIVKTVYKKPVASIATVIAGAAVMLLTQNFAFLPLMTVCLTAGIAGMAYGAYNIIKADSSNTRKQAIEVLGISTFIIGVGVYGLLL